MAAAEEGPGVALQAARQARQLSVVQVADRLKLSSAVVAALEANDKGRLPAPVFVRGYVRAYARLLGLPAEELLDDDRSDAAAQAKVESSAIQTPEGRPGSVWWAAGAISALAAMAAALAMLAD